LGVDGSEVESERGDAGSAKYGALEESPAGEFHFKPPANLPHLVDCDADPEKL
jgi:hypothetical protein